MPRVGGGGCTIRRVGWVLRTEAWRAPAFKGKAKEGTPEREAEETSIEVHGETGM